MKDFLKKIIHLFIIKKSYSQENEDLFLIRYFKNIRNGFYVDIGCHHPKRFSNTYLLYKKGWNGINVDANKFTISLFKIFRPRDKSSCFVLSTSSEPVIFYEFSESALSGILDSKKANKLVDLGFPLKSKKKIKPFAVQEFVNQYDLLKKKINFFKIDVEGMDHDIIKKLKISDMNIEILMIEKSNKTNNKIMENYLKKFSFKILHETKRNFLFKKTENG